MCFLTDPGQNNIALSIVKCAHYDFEESWENWWFERYFTTSNKKNILSTCIVKYLFGALGFILSSALLEVIITSNADTTPTIIAYGIAILIALMGVIVIGQSLVAYVTYLYLRLYEPRHKMSYIKASIFDELLAIDPEDLPWVMESFLAEDFILPENLNISDQEICELRAWIRRGVKRPPQLSKLATLIFRSALPKGRLNY